MLIVVMILMMVMMMLLMLMWMMLMHEFIVDVVMMMMLLLLLLVLVLVVVRGRVVVVVVVADRVDQGAVMIFELLELADERLDAALELRLAAHHLFEIGAQVVHLLLLLHYVLAHLAYLVLELLARAHVHAYHVAYGLGVGAHGVVDGARRARLDLGEHVDELRERARRYLADAELDAIGQLQQVRVEYLLAGRGELVLDAVARVVVDAHRGGHQTIVVGARRTLAPLAGLEVLEGVDGLLLVQTHELLLGRVSAPYVRRYVLLEHRSAAKLTRGHLLLSTRTTTTTTAATRGHAMKMRCICGGGCGCRRRS